MKFKNKVVLITGSSRGIGRATAIMFSKEGAKVVVNYSKSEKEAKEVLNEVKKYSDGIIIKCDVSNEKQVEKMFKKIINKFGKLDVLVNNAGVYIDGDEWNGEAKIWEETLRKDLISVMICSKFAAQIFLKQKYGVIVNISSRYSISGRFDSLAYAAAKAAIVNITQGYASLLNKFGGKANAISPGAVKSGYWLRAPKEELEAQGKLIEPEEIAKEVLFLASDNAKEINGKNILIDKGERSVLG
jgi:3-oxoacyl-[acyl-carrier protein] reductase